MREQAAREAAPTQRQLRVRLVAWFPTIAVAGVVAVIVATFVTGWPDPPSWAGGAIADGFVVTVDQKAGTVLYGYTVGDAPRIFREVPIGEGTANPGYRWDSVQSGSRIKVIYEPRDPLMSEPYLDFPFWAVGSWSMLGGFVAAVVAVWIRKRWLTKERR